MGSQENGCFPLSSSSVNRFSKTATILNSTASLAAAKPTGLKIHVATEEFLGPKYDIKKLFVLLDISLLVFILLKGLAEQKMGYLLYH